MPMLPEMEKAGFHLGNIGKNEAPPDVTYATNFLKWIVSASRCSNEVINTSINNVEAC